MRKFPSNKLLHAFPRFFDNIFIQRILRNSGYLFSATGVSAGLSMLQSILVARLLGVTDFGILGTITVFTSVVNKFASFRMSELVIKYVGEYSVSGDTRRAAAVFKAAGVTETLTSIVAFLLIWLLAPLGARYFAKDVGLAGWFVLYGLIVLANFMSESSTGLLQIFDRYRPIAIVTVGQSIVTLILVALAYSSAGGLLEVLLAYMVGKMIGSISLTVLAWSEASHRWGSKWWGAPIGLLKDRLGEVGRFAVSTNISATINLVNKDGELLWVSALSSPTGAGYYKLALSLVNLLQLPVSPLPQATYPELSREAARKNWTGLRQVLRQGTQLAFTYSLLASLGLMIFGPLIIRIFYTTEFLPAYPAILILLAGYLVADTFYWNRIALLALGLPDYPTKVNLIAAGLKIAGILIIVPVYGYLGSAVLLSGFYLFSVSLNVIKTFSLMKERQVAAA